MLSWVEGYNGHRIDFFIGHFVPAGNSSVKPPCEDEFDVINIFLNFLRTTPQTPQDTLYFDINRHIILYFEKIITCLKYRMRDLTCTDAKLNRLDSKRVT